MGKQDPSSYSQPSRSTAKRPFRDRRPITEIPPEIRDRIFKEVIKDGIRIKNNKYDFSKITGSLKANKVLAVSLMRALEADFPLVAFECDLLGIQAWLQQFSIPWVTVIPNQVAQHIATGRFRVHVAILRTITPTYQPTFRALLNVDHLRNLCHAMALYLYEVSQYLWSWDWRTTLPGGDVEVRDLGAPPTGVMATITRGLRGMRPDEENRLFANLEIITCPGMAVVVNNRGHTPAGPTTMDIMGPTRFRLSSAAFAFLDMIKTGYSVMAWHYRRGNHQELENMYDAVDSSFRMGFLTQGITHPGYLANAPMMSNFAPQYVAASAIMLDCAAMVHTSMLKNNLFNQANNFSTTLRQLEHTLRGLHGVNNSGILQTFINEIDRHPDILRTGILEQIVGYPHTHRHIGQAGLGHFLQEAILYYSTLQTAMPARNDIRQELQALQQIQNMPLTFASWRGGQMSMAQTIAWICPGLPTDVPFTAAAHNLHIPAGRRGWL